MDKVTIKETKRLHTYKDPFLEVRLSYLENGLYLVSHKQIEEEYFHIKLFNNKEEALIEYGFTKGLHILDRPWNKTNCGQIKINAIDKCQ